MNSNHLPENWRELSFLVNETLISRERLANQLADPRRDIDFECGYPEYITADIYRSMYDRNGIAERVVNIFPEESWAKDPLIKETTGTKQTKFDKQIIELDEQHCIFSFMQRADAISGIGRYGVILVGLDDGKDLIEPVPGIDLRTGRATGKNNHSITYLRTFDESQARIVRYISDQSSPLYGMPEIYEIQFVNYHLDDASAEGTNTTENVHWTRLIHLADKRLTSEIFAVPRMQSSYNRLYDTRKMLAGSGEMYWRGAFPGISLETMPGFEDAVIDKEQTKLEMEAYMNGLQRYLLNQGLTAKSLPPQVQSPRDFLMTQLHAIAITIGVPLRIFMGSEQAQLASAQDVRNFNRRIKKRQHRYLSPFVIRPFIQRLIDYGAINPPVKTYSDGRAKYMIKWPDVDVPTEKDQAEIGDKWTTALQKYVASEVYNMISPLDYFVTFLGIEPAVAEPLAIEAEKRIEEYQQKVEEQTEFENKMSAVSEVGSTPIEAEKDDAGLRQDDINKAKENNRNDISTLPGEKEFEDET